MESILHKFIYASVFTFVEILFPSLLLYETFEILDFLSFVCECAYPLTLA